MEINRADGSPIEDVVLGTEITPPVWVIHRVFRKVDEIRGRVLRLPTLETARTKPTREIEVRLRWEQGAKFEVAIHPDDMAAGVRFTSAVGQPWATRFEPRDILPAEGMLILRPGIQTWWVEGMAGFGVVFFCRGEEGKKLDA